MLREMSAGSHLSDCTTSLSAVGPKPSASICVHRRSTRQGTGKWEAIQRVGVFAFRVYWRIWRILLFRGALAKNARLGYFSGACPSQIVVWPAGSWLFCWLVLAPEFFRRTPSFFSPSPTPR